MRAYKVTRFVRLKLVSDTLGTNIHCRGKAMFSHVPIITICNDTIGLFMDYNPLPPGLKSLHPRWLKPRLNLVNELKRKMTMADEEEDGDQCDQKKSPKVHKSYPKMISIEQ